MEGHPEKPRNSPETGASVRGEPVEQPTADQPPLRRIERHVVRRLVSGFLVLVPLLIVIVIIRFIFVAMDGLFRPFFAGRPWDIQGIGVVISLILLYVVGAFFAGRRLQSWQDAILSRIPLVSTIYSVSRQSIEALSSPTGHHFSRVVFLEYPRPGVRAMGFVTGHLHSGLNEGPPIVVVYIPTVPNPTSGMLAWVPEEEVIETDFTVEEAMKAVFSGGIVLPEARARLGHEPTPQLEEGHED